MHVSACYQFPGAKLARGESRGPDAPRQQNQSDSWDFHKPCQNSKYYSSGYGVSTPSW